jgi:hypothetical protein
LAVEVEGPVEVFVIFNDTLIVAVVVASDGKPEIVDTTEYGVPTGTSVRGE